MEDTTRFISENLKAMLPAWLIHFLWFLVKDIPPDRLGRKQVFELKKTQEGQSICLTQEQPVYRQGLCIPCPAAVNATVCVLHERCTSTMLLEGEMAERFSSKDD